MEFGYKASKDIFKKEDFGKWKFCEEEDIRAVVGNNDFDLKKAFHQKESTIFIKDETIGNTFLLAGKIQEGHLPLIILKRLEGNRVCNVSVGERTIIPVTEEIVPDLLALWETLESERIEIDIEDVVKRKFNLYYGN